MQNDETSFDLLLAHLRSRIDLLGFKRDAHGLFRNWKDREEVKLAVKEGLAYVGLLPVDEAWLDAYLAVRLGALIRQAGTLRASWALQSILAFRASLVPRLVYPDERDDLWDFDPDAFADEEPEAFAHVVQRLARVREQGESAEGDYDYLKDPVTDEDFPPYEGLRWKVADAPLYVRITNEDPMGVRLALEVLRMAADVRLEDVEHEGVRSLHHSIRRSMSGFAFVATDAHGHYVGEDVFLHAYGSLETRLAKITEKLWSQGSPLLALELSACSGHHFGEIHRFVRDAVWARTISSAFLAFLKYAVLRAKERGECALRIDPWVDFRFEDEVDFVLAPELARCVLWCLATLGSLVDADAARDCAALSQKIRRGWPALADEVCNELSRLTAGRADLLEAMREGCSSDAAVT